MVMNTVARFNKRKQYEEGMTLNRASRHFQMAFLSRSHFQSSTSAICSRVQPNRTGHINLVILALSYVSHTSLSTCCFPREPHTRRSWWPATEITEQCFEGQHGGLIVFCSFISLAADRCWAWRMERPLVGDRKWRGPKERDPANTR